MKASEILREAAREVDAHWVRNNFEHAGRVCAVGALRKVAFGHATWGTHGGTIAQRQEYRRAADALAQWFKDHGMGGDSYLADSVIVHVNDHVAKNRQDISRAMEKVAAKLEEQV